MKIRQVKIILIILVLALLGISLVWAFSSVSKNYCIKIGESNLVGKCKIGCCIDEHGFEHNKYPRELCENQEGKFYSGECKNSFVCS